MIMVLPGQHHQSWTARGSFGASTTGTTIRRTAFDNTLGTAVALDIENLRFTYDLTDGATNPGGVRFIAADLTTAGACAPGACFPTQIRKVNVLLTARSENAKTRRTRSRGRIETR